MFRVSSIFLVAASIGLVASIVDYCSQTSQLCSTTGYQHVTCGATGDLGPACPSDARVIELSDENIQQILDMHNKYRNQIASGNLPGFKSAAKMSTLVCNLTWKQFWLKCLTSMNFKQQWNQDLADYAGLNVRRCQYGHDCHNTPENKYSGQNINSKTTFGGGSQFSKIPEFIDSSINVWWNEKDLASQAVIDNCCGSGNIPHFLEMASDRVTHVGCAISQYTDSQGKKSYMVCNYSFTIILSQQVYVSGPPASQCQSGSNPNYQALCSVNEMVDPNKVF